jgi:hypothetical protein
MASEPPSLRDDYGRKIHVGRTQDGEFCVSITEGLRSVMAVLSGERLEAFTEAVDRLGVPGQAPPVAEAREIRACARCEHVLVDQDELGWYYQVPATDPEVPGLTFMDRVHDCDGKPHDVRVRI